MTSQPTVQALQSTSDVSSGDKERQLMSLLEQMKSAVVAYSGGVDSTYLADVAHQVLGGRALIVTAKSPSMATGEIVFAQTLAAERGWNFRVVHTAETDDPRWLANDADRCYFCKAELFSVLGALARSEGITHLLFGAIPEDFGDVRPGFRAAAEFGVTAPLIDARLTKAEIREQSRKRGLPTWDKPQAACLASRFPTGTGITVDELRRVDHAEAALAALGFLGHRVRHHGELARIELQNSDWSKISSESLRLRAVEVVRAAGYKYVTIDLAGYRPAGQNH